MQLDLSVCSAYRDLSVSFGNPDTVLCAFIGHQNTIIKDRGKQKAH